MGTNVLFGVIVCFCFSFSIIKTFSIALALTLAAFVVVYSNQSALHFKGVKRPRVCGFGFIRTQSTFPR